MSKTKLEEYLINNGMTKSSCVSKTTINMELVNIIDPSFIMCPLTLQIYWTPVRVGDGEPYELQAIQQHIETNGYISPKTRMNIHNPIIDYHTKGLVDMFLKHHPEFTEDQYVPILNKQELERILKYKTFNELVRHEEFDLNAIQQLLIPSQGIIKGSVTKMCWNILCKNKHFIDRVLNNYIAATNYNNSIYKSTFYFASWEILKPYLPKLTDNKICFLARYIGLNNYKKLVGLCSFYPDCIYHPRKNLLSYMCYHKKAHLIKYLMARDTHNRYDYTDSKYGHPLITACNRCDHDIIILIFNKYDKTVVSDKGITPIAILEKRGMHDTIQYMKDNMEDRLNITSEESSESFYLSLD